MPAAKMSSWFSSFFERRVAPLRADQPVLISFVVFLLVAGVLVPLSLDYWLESADFLVNVVAEAHGMLMDLLVFGCLLLWLDQKAERQRRIERYRNAIDDYLGWETEEAMYRIVGNVRRLNREGAVPETLKDAYLSGADLRGTDLSEGSLNGADLSGADLQDADLSGAYLGNADLSGADLYRADLSNAHFGVFAGMHAPEGERETTLEGAFLREADLRDVRSATADTFRNVRTLYKARLDPELRAEIEDRYPELLEPRPSDVRE